MTRESIVQVHVRATRDNSMTASIGANSAEGAPAHIWVTNAQKCGEKVQGKKTLGVKKASQNGSTHDKMRQASNRNVWQK